jgi:prepilin-type N-terminal cleavage/methylation domain-containing protein/prepilin-type processing-associated H-X9-DG protein
MIPCNPTTQWSAATQILGKQAVSGRDNSSQWVDQAGPFSCRHQGSAFTLVELLIVIAIIGILAALILPSLTRAKGQAQSVACLNNLKQLQICWQMYAMDNEETLVPNNSVVAIPGSGTPLASGASWCVGSARYDSTTTNIENGLLFEYNRSVGIYRCPADQSTIEDLNGNKLPSLRTRSYNLSQSVNGFAEYDLVMRDYIPSFKKLTLIQNPEIANCLVFIDEHADTMYDALFGMPTEHYDGTKTWWDLPSDRHNQGGNLSFADGHVEHWKWTVPKTFKGWIQGVPAEELADWQRLKGSMRQTMN